MATKAWPVVLAALVGVAVGGASAQSVIGAEVRAYAGSLQPSEWPGGDGQVDASWQIQDGPIDVGTPIVYFTQWAAAGAAANLQTETLRAWWLGAVTLWPTCRPCSASAPFAISEARVSETRVFGGGRHGSSVPMLAAPGFEHVTMVSAAGAQLLPVPKPASGLLVLFALTGMLAAASSRRRTIPADRTDLRLITTRQTGSVLRLPSMERLPSSQLLLVGEPSRSVPCGTKPSFQFMGEGGSCRHRTRLDSSGLSFTRSGTLAREDIGGGGLC